jgi:hypothetical protein
LTEIYHLLGMKSSRDDLIDRMKTGWGCFVLASSSLYYDVTSCPVYDAVKCKNVDFALCAGWLRRSTFAASWESFPPRQDAELF